MTSVNSFLVIISHKKESYIYWKDYKDEDQIWHKWERKNTLKLDKCSRKVDCKSRVFMKSHTGAATAAPPERKNEPPDGKLVLVPNKKETEK